jgi:Protein of unknown function (DUF2934)
MASRAMKIDPRKTAISDRPTQPTQHVTSPSEDETAISVRAYQLWQERGCPEGSPEVDWYQAEEQLKTVKAPIARTA